jgi:hypothetical protein
MANGQPSAFGFDAGAAVATPGGGVSLMGPGRAQALRTFDPNPNRQTPAPLQRPDNTRLFDRQREWRHGRQQHGAGGGPLPQLPAIGGPGLNTATLGQEQPTGPDYVTDHWGRRWNRGTAAYDAVGGDPRKARNLEWSNQGWNPVYGGS